MIVKCNQSGRRFTVKVDELSTLDGEPVDVGNDLKESCQLLLDYDKKCYPVTVIRTVINNEGNWSFYLYIMYNQHYKKIFSKLDQAPKRKKTKRTASGDASSDSVSVIQQAKEVVCEILFIQDFFLSVGGPFYKLNT